MQRKPEIVQRRLSTDPKRCPVCKGTGKDGRDKPCKACGGTGDIQVEASKHASQ